MAFTLKYKKDGTVAELLEKALSLNEEDYKFYGYDIHINIEIKNNKLYLLLRIGSDFNDVNNTEEGYLNIYDIDLNTDLNKLTLEMNAFVFKSLNEFDVMMEGELGLNELYN